MAKLVQLQNGRTWKTQGAALAHHLAGEEVRVFLEGSGGRIAEDRAAAMLQTALPMMLDFLGLLRLKAFLRAMRDDASKKDN